MIFTFATLSVHLIQRKIDFFLKELYDDHPVCEVMSINPDMLQNACFRIMTTKTVFQKTLSIIKFENIWRKIIPLRFMHGNYNLQNVQTEQINTFKHL